MIVIVMAALLAPLPGRATDAAPANQQTLVKALARSSRMNTH